MQIQEISNLLNSKYREFCRTDFIKNDPICIPHSYSQVQDIEIAGFFTAIFSWGLRKTIINKARTLMKLMDDSPYEFVINHSASDLKLLQHFVHRTFNGDDLLYFIAFLKYHYNTCVSLEDAFLKGDSMEQCLINFETYFFSLPYYLQRTKKHIATPARKSTCKRINMYLRWMVRKDNEGVDFGIWKRLKASDLYIPYDVHVERVARKLGLINRKQNDWATVVELTNTLKAFDPNDPVKYDYALFGMGVMESND